MTPDGMDRLVELLDSAIEYIGVDQPELVPSLAEARDVVEIRAAQERAELAAELSGQEWAPGLVDQRGLEGPLAGAPGPAFTVTAAGVRGAIEEVLAYHHERAGGREPDPDGYGRARDFLNGLPPLPGQLGDTMAEVLGRGDGSNMDDSLANVARSLGWQPPGPTGGLPASAAGSERVAGLQDARDTALDRAIGATLRIAELGAEGKADTTALADATSWTGLHEQAVKALVRVGAADVPRTVPAALAPAPGPDLERALTTNGGQSPSPGPRPRDVDPWW